MKTNKIMAKIDSTSKSKAYDENSDPTDIRDLFLIENPNDF